MIFIDFWKGGRHKQCEFIFDRLVAGGRVASKDLVKSEILNNWIINHNN